MIDCSGNVPPKRYYHGATIVGNSLFIYGGWGMKYLNDLH